MAALLSKLLARTKVAIVSGGALPQFIGQVVDRLPQDAQLSHLYLLPTSGAALYERSQGWWTKVYEEFLTEEEMRHIEQAMREVCKETGLIDFSSPSYGERIEHRVSEVTLSALGQQAPIAEKAAWDPDKSKRRILQQMLSERLPEYAVAMGGATSIDVTKKGIDKAYGIRKVAEYLRIPVEEMLYVGDQLEEGGNDEAATRTPIKTHAVANPEDTKQFITSLL